MRRWTNKIKNKQYGQAMVEFALTLPIFLLAVIGVIELSRFFLVYSSVYTASREAARYGSSVGEDGNIHYMDCDGIRQVAQDTGFFGGVNTANVNVYYEEQPGASQVDCPFDVPLGNRLVVEVEAEYTPLIAGFVLPDGIMVSARNGRTIMKEIKLDVTPIPLPICIDDIKFVGSLQTPATYSYINKNRVLVINVKNVSPYSTYRIDSISNLNWQDDLDLNKKIKLNTVRWDGNIIWTSTAGYSTPITINSTSWGTSLRNLPAGQTFLFALEFDKTVPNKAIETIQFTINFSSTRPGIAGCSLIWP